MKAPEDYQYTAQHMWVKPLGDGNWLAGITDYAQDLLGDIVFIEPPTVNSQLVAGLACGNVESVKTGSDLHSPLDGEVVTINSEVINAPEQLNGKPYEAWIFKIKTSEHVKLAHLLNANSYKSLVKD